MMNKPRIRKLRSGFWVCAQEGDEFPGAQALNPKAAYANWAYVESVMRHHQQQMEHTKPTHLTQMMSIRPVRYFDWHNFP